MRQNQHVVPNKGRWSVKTAGNNLYTVITRTKKEAIDIARLIAKSQRSELVIHGRNGRIQDRDSYGRDAREWRDTKF
jgi:hypothetical protein